MNIYIYQRLEDWWIGSQDKMWRWDIEKCEMYLRCQDEPRLYNTKYRNEQSQSEILKMALYYWRVNESPIGSFENCPPLDWDFINGFGGCRVISVTRYYFRKPILFHVYRTVFPLMKCNNTLYWESETRSRTRSSFSALLNSW